MINDVSDDPYRGANPLDPEYRRDPHPFLHRLREVEPVNRMPIGVWRLTRYADVKRLLEGVPAGVRMSDGTLPDFDESLVRQREFISHQDDPSHARLRRLFAAPFARRSMGSIRAMVENVVDECLDKCATKSEFDAVGELAVVVPTRVVCGILGIEPPSDDRLNTWTGQATFGIAAPLAPPVIEMARQAGAALTAFIEDAIKDRRAHPKQDFLGKVLEAEQNGNMSHSELLSQLVGMLIAAQETTVGLIGNGLKALLSHSDELAKLRARPELIDSAIEECLRWDGPVAAAVRVLHADAEFGGHLLPKDTRIWGMLNAANRDPAAFPDPDRFDIERSPNDHLAFGGGAHYCLGAHLARLQGRVAIGSLVSRFPDLSLCPGETGWRMTIFRAPARLPISREARFAG
jgi:cytochrome P450